MQLCRYQLDSQSEPRLALVRGDSVFDLAAAGGPGSLAEALRLPAAEFHAQLRRARDAAGAARSRDGIVILAPIDAQEVWAAGVTYSRSRDARMEESTQKDVYDLVYEADRPEIFFKATPNRVSGPGADIAIRADSGWDVPEPELTLVLNAMGELVGYTIGNDVSSRTIEGENPLYLPQAKLYSQSAALGPVIVTTDEISNPLGLTIQLTIRRDGEILFQESTSTANLHRTIDDLVRYLFRANEFPNGVFLMTGTGIVPPNAFTLNQGDHVSIAIDGIGTLSNPVVRLPV